MNQFFEQVGKKVSKTSQEAVKKTKDLTEIAKIKAQITDEEKRLNKIYMNLGQQYYQLKGENPDLIFNDLCKAIESCLQNIDRYNVMVNEIKGIKRCSVCGTEMSIASTYCQCCGHKLVDERERVVAFICSNCGMENGAHATMCIGCGQIL